MVQNRAWRICSVTERVTDMCWNMLALAMCEAVSMTPLDHMVDEQPSKVIPVPLFVGERGGRLWTTVLFNKGETRLNCAHTSR